MDANYVNLHNIKFISIEKLDNGNIISAQRQNKWKCVGV